MKKRGISAVVATILIILIVVVGVGIVWKVVLPIFAELEFLSYSDVRLNIVFQGHTVYDAEQNFAFVQIERGKDEVNVTGIEIGFNFDGTTKTYQSKKVPTPNGKYTYKFNFTNDSEFGIPEDVAPDKVTVAPIFTINNKVRLGKILDEKPMPSGRIHLSAEAWKKANDEAAIPIVVTTGSGDGDEPGDPVVPECTVTGIEVCGNDVDEDCNGGDLACPTCDPLTEVLYGNVCAININSLGSAPYNLDIGGAIYVLTEDIILTKGHLYVIRISADDIILDGNGYTLIGDGSNTGVYSNEVGGGVVRNLTISNFSWGVSSSGSDNFVYNNLILINNHYMDSGFDVGAGIHLAFASSNNTLSNLNTSFNGLGISFEYSCEDNYIFDSVSTHNELGVYFFMSRNNNVSVSSCYNSDYDIYCSNSLGDIDLGSTYDSSFGCDDWIGLSEGVC